MLKPLRTFGSPVADTIGTMPYPELQRMLDAVAPFGRRSYWKSRFLSELPDAAIDTFVAFAESRTSPHTLAILEHSHGAMARVAPDATAFPARRTPFDLVVISLWDQMGDDALNIDWTRRFHAAMEPWSAGSVYVNSLDQDESARVSEAYGGNFARLADVKARFDPQNLFRHNHNVQPRAA